MGDPWCRTRLVGRQSSWLLHRSAGAGRCEGDAALLPRAPAPQGRAVRGGYALRWELFFDVGQWRILLRKSVARCLAFRGALTLSKESTRLTQFSSQFVIIIPMLT